MNIEFSVVLESLFVIVCYQGFHLSYNQFRLGEQEQQPAKVIHIEFNNDKLKTTVPDQKPTYHNRTSQTTSLRTIPPVSMFKVKCDGFL